MSGWSLSIVFLISTFPLLLSRYSYGVDHSDRQTQTQSSREANRQISPKQVQALIRQLGSRSYSLREKATKQLVGMGRPILKYLERWKGKDLEIAKRIQSIKESVDPKAVLSKEKVLSQLKGEISKEFEKEKKAVLQVVKALKDSLSQEDKKGLRELGQLYSDLPPQLRRLEPKAAAKVYEQVSELLTREKTIWNRVLERVKKKGFKTHDIKDENFGVLIQANGKVVSFTPQNFGRIHLQPVRFVSEPSVKVKSVLSKLTPKNVRKERLFFENGKNINKAKALNFTWNLNYVDHATKSDSAVMRFAIIGLKGTEYDPSKVFEQIITPKGKAKPRQAFEEYYRRQVEGKGPTGPQPM